MNNISIWIISNCVYLFIIIGAVIYFLRSIKILKKNDESERKNVLFNLISFSLTMGLMPTGFLLILSVFDSSLIKYITEYKQYIVMSGISLIYIGGKNFITKL